MHRVFFGLGDKGYQLVGAILANDLVDGFSLGEHNRFESQVQLFRHF